MVVMQNPPIGLVEISKEKDLNQIEIIRVVFNSSLKQRKTIGLIRTDLLTRALNKIIKINPFNKLNQLGYNYSNLEKINKEKIPTK